MDITLPWGGRRSLLVCQALIAILLFFSPDHVFADLASAVDPRIESTDEAQGARFPINDTSSLRVVSFTSPELTFFENAAAFLFEDRRRIAALGGSGFPGKLALNSSSSLGVVFMPSFPDYDYSTIREQAAAKADSREPSPIARSDLEKSVALASLSLSGGYDLRIPVPGRAALELRLDNELSVRIAYNFYDLAPTLDFLREGRSIAEAVAEHYSGTAFSRLKDEAAASLTADLGGNRALKAEGGVVFTDLLYQDYRLRLSFSWDERMELGAACSWASYATYNGISPDRLGLSFSAHLAGKAVFRTEAAISPLGSDGYLRMTLSFGKPAEDGAEGGARRANPGAAFVDPSYFSGEGDSGGQATTLATLHDEAVDRDIHAFLDIRGRSFSEVTNLLYTYRKSLARYDYSRAVDFLAPDRLTGSDPRDFLDKGGVCVDGARFVGTVLENNSITARTVMIQSLGGSAHSFAVARDADGSFYAVDGFARVRKIESAASFSDAAAVYLKGFSQLATLSLDGRVDAVLASPDTAALDAVLGY